MAEESKGGWTHPREVQWYVAKYIPDLMRGEPRNIGVILRLASTREVSPEQSVQWRFCDPPPVFIRSTSNYRAWIAHWESTLKKHGSRCLHWIAKHHPNDNYYIVFSGHRMVGGEVDFDELFDRLVGDPDPNESMGTETAPPQPKQAPRW